MAAVESLNEAAASLPGCVVLGPSPAPIAKVKEAWRWQALVKAPAGSDIASVVRAGLAGARLREGVSAAPDIDPVDML